ncbi:MAG: hypothetical protein WCL06_09585 [Bacteroidota bacterium]
MILPNMTLEEIRKEIDKDFPILHRKMKYVQDDLDKKYSKLQKREGYTEYFEYTSKYKNHYIYKIQRQRKHTERQSMLVYHNGIGHVGIGVTYELHILYYTAHFFKRYNERRNLGYILHNDIVRALLNENDHVGFTELEEIAPNIHTIYGFIKSGMILGTYNRNVDLVKLHTYLTNEMLNQNQNDRMTHLKEVLLKYEGSSATL